MSALGDSMIAVEARSQLLDESAIRDLTARYEEGSLSRVLTMRFLAPAVVVLNVGPTRPGES